MLTSEVNFKVKIEVKYNVEASVWLLKILKLLIGLSWNYVCRFSMTQTVHNLIFVDLWGQLQGQNWGQICYRNERLFALNSETANYIQLKFCMLNSDDPNRAQFNFCWPLRSISRSKLIYLAQVSSVVLIGYKTGLIVERLSEKGLLRILLV